MSAIASCSSLLISPVRARSGVVRIDPLRFMAGCRTRRLNQALSVLSLSPDFFSVSVVLGSLLRCVVLCYLCVLSLGCVCQVVSTSASD